MTRSRQTIGVEAGDIELEVALDTVCFLIAKAREFDVKTGTSDPDAPLVDDDDVDAAVLEDRPSDPVESEILSVIRDLDEDEQIDLVALMWLGRDDGTAEDWDETRQTAAEEHNDKTAEYLVGTPLLSDFLEAGLDAIGLSCGDYMENDV